MEWLDAVSGEIVAKELYDHASDPEENRNTAHEEGQQTNLQMLHEKLWSLLPKPTFPLPITQQGAANRLASSDTALNWNPQIATTVVPRSKPDGTFRIRTRPGIVWLVRTTNGQALGYFVVEPKPQGQAAAVIPR